MSKVTVLLSTYNGEKYLREQIDSILNQEDVEISIIARDDGSKDRTIEILNYYSEQFNNFSFYTGDNKGPAGSFFDLINHSGGSEYYAFADQDDVWDKDKIKVAVDNLSKRNSEIPLLYYSNLRIVDQNLNFCRLSHNKPRMHKDKYLSLTEGLMTGCTGVFNESLAKMIRGHVPTKCSMHDTWLYMIAMFFGEAIYDFSPHISYRQHEGNVIGAHKGKYNFKAIIKRVKRLFNRDLQPKYTNACSFDSIYGSSLSKTDRDVILKIVNYKKTFSSWMSLLFCTKIHTTSVEREIRYRLLILLRII